MSATLHNFAQLNGLLDRERDPSAWRELLAGSVPDAQALMTPLEPVRRLATAPPRSLDDDLLYELFALSTVDDLLVSTPALPTGDRDAFFSALGFEPFSATVFSPLTCEIVEVSNADIAPESGIRVERVHWSGLSYGELVFARSGVSIRCHPSLDIVQGIADKSMLHFTNHRPVRAVNDLSHGWGHNSRWSTDFHRNYQVRGIAFYNVDAEFDIGVPNARLQWPGRPPHALDLAQARELLMHRGFVRTPRFKDEWPYGWRMAVSDSGRAWPLDEADLLPFDAALRRAGLVA